MTDQTAQMRVPRIRVANFTDIAIPRHAALSIAGKSTQDAVAEIRRHADFPYVYLMYGNQATIVEPILEELRSIRSPCYPYAGFTLDGSASFPLESEVELIQCTTHDPEEISARISSYSVSALTFEKSRLKNNNPRALPAQVDVIIIGAGVTGLYAAMKLSEKGRSFCILDKRDISGGIWSQYANVTSQVNTSEAAYRLLEHETRTNIDHSSTAEMLRDVEKLAGRFADQLFTETEVTLIKKENGGYSVTVTRNGDTHRISGTGIILAINDRVGTPRTVVWEGEEGYQGALVNGISDETIDVDWRGKKVVVVGMGAFAVENARTALEAGAAHVTVVCRRHGTVCPKIIDYLNFSTPYDDKFAHDRKSNIRNMLLWKKLYEASGATEPECWMGKIKHEGHTISVSDIWFIAHHLKKLSTVSGSVNAMYDRGVIVGDGRRIDADVVVKCVGFLRNGETAKKLCEYTEMYNNNYVDRDFMYLADAYIDDEVFNSFFGSSILEMTKFYISVYLDFFDNPEFDEMIRSEGMYKISIDDRRWSHYIAGAESLIRRYPRFYDAAKAQIEDRTASFLETHDLETYIAANRREWFSTHELLAGKSLSEAECLPYVFEKLVQK